METVRSNIANNCTKIFHRLKDYVIKNWGSPFLVGFMVLLIGSAVYSSKAYLLLTPFLSMHFTL